MFEQWPKPVERKEKPKSEGIFNQVMERLPKRSLSMIILSASLFSGHKNAEAVSLDEFIENMKADSNNTSEILDKKESGLRIESNFNVAVPKMPGSVELNEKAAKKVEFNTEKNENAAKYEFNGEYFYNKDGSGNVQGRLIKGIK